MSTTLDTRRNQLVDTILTRYEVPAAVEHALRTVPRHLHLPGLDPADAYADKAVTIKDNPGGPLALSCASVPSVVAMMLAQLDAQPGDRILEIGAGTGYNAALLHELVGDDGTVVTVDIDPDVTLHARNALNRSGHERVTVIERDGLHGAPEHGPFDKIIATVGMWDIPAGWWEQLRDGGRVVVPLRWRGQTRSVALVHDGDILRGLDMKLCGFVPVIGQNGERSTSLAEDTVRLHHDVDQPADPQRLTAALATPPIEVWSSTWVGSEEPFDGVWLRATATDDTVCRIEMTGAALDDGLRRPVIPIRTPALVAADSLAYMILRRGDEAYQLGAAGYGPAADNLARDLVDVIDAWGLARSAAPQLTIYRTQTPTATPPNTHTVVKHEARIGLTYLHAAA